MIHRCLSGQGTVAMPLLPCLHVAAQTPVCMGVFVLAITVYVDQEDCQLMQKFKVNPVVCSIL